MAKTRKTTTPSTSTGPKAKPVSKAAMAVPANKPAVAKTASQPTAAKVTAKAAAKPASQAKGKRNGSLTPEITLTLNHDQIAQRAFAIWVAKGKPQGQDIQNWNEAETQLRQELARRA